MPTITFADLSGQGVRLVGASSSSFSQLLQQRVDPETIALLSPILPYAVIVLNDSAQAITALTVQYSLKNPAGKPITYRMTLSTLNRAREQMLLPGELALFVPKQKLCAKLRSGSNKMALKNAPLNWPSQNLFDSQTDIQISIDVTIFEDGSAIGIDAGSTVARRNAFLEAGHDIATAVLARSGADLKSYLSQLASAQKSPVDDPYGFEAESLASRFYEELNQSDEATLKSSVNRFLSLRASIPAKGSIQ
jgi:hypothetical protein